jgi:hypothetical protein
MELLVLQMRRELVPAALWSEYVAKYVLECRGKLEGLGHRLAPRLVGLGTAHEARVLVDEAVREALLELCNLDLTKINLAVSDEGVDDEDGK